MTKKLLLALLALSLMILSACSPRQPQHRKRGEHIG